MEAINAKVATLSLKMLKDMAVQLNDDFRDGADAVQSAVMDRLMRIMPASDFVSFCAALEG